ncbi:MAG: 23S rRNA (pseudouridine(1915)-N(3))-methyltransferase RlmH [Clostridiales bacterium]|jgi:23S rRNA (pseudouridine1915-N3)-methyltransferase|nr:23S rRNA (pseudouridine(1915)-N(3))-methyltransferase RlmH [Clostridiales bacterium]
MNASIVCVGRLKEKWQRDGVEEYLKRLSRYGKYEIREVDDRPDALGAKAAEREGEAILKRIRLGEHVVALAIDGPAPDSPGLARLVDRWAREHGRATLVIGGSNGLSKEVLERADEKLSFSNLTFPHGLMRVVLLEQLYRAERILANEPYHK